MLWLNTVKLKNQLKFEMFENIWDAREKNKINKYEYEQIFTCITVC